MNNFVSRRVFSILYFLVEKINFLLSKLFFKIKNKKYTSHKKMFKLKFLDLFPDINCAT